MKSILSSWMFLDIPEKPVWDSIREQKIQERSKKRDLVFCANCNHVITSVDQKISIHHSHVKEFMNPHGIVFRMGCFKAAEGGCFASKPTEEWTWFKGFSWRIVDCASCSTHLGWYFQNKTGNDFFGLILNRLAT